MNAYDPAASAAEQRLIETVRALGLAVEEAEAAAAHRVHEMPLELLVGSSVTRASRPKRSFYASLAGLAALLVAGVVGIAVLIGGAGPQPVKPGGNTTPSHSTTVSGVPPATTVPPLPGPQSSAGTSP